MNEKLVYIMEFLVFISFIIFLSCFLLLKKSTKTKKLDEDVPSDQKETLEINQDKIPLITKNQKELMRYYNTNLTLNEVLYGASIITIISGILIVIASLFMYISLNFDKILLFVGGLTGIIVIFIGIILIRMYAKNIKIMIKFHNQLIETNSLLLANSIASKIDDDMIRDEALAEISKKCYTK